MSDAIEYFIGDELDPISLWVERGDTSGLVDFSVAHTYSASLTPYGSGGDDVFVAPKTTGFTGAAGTGNERSGTPNLLVDWATTGELNDVTDPGFYRLQIVCTRTSDSKQRTIQVLLELTARD